METMRKAIAAAWRWVPALLVCGTVGLAYAKLPPPPPVDPAKAAEAKEKTAAAAKRDAEALTKAQDRAVENYKKTKSGGSGAAVMTKTVTTMPKK
ncbi:MAG: hypothetical protein ACT4PS_16285 [Betaproteobacteria bacterium]